MIPRALFSCMHCNSLPVFLAVLWRVLPDNTVGTYLEKLVGDFNPSEKYQSNWNISQIGMKIF